MRSAFQRGNIVLWLLGGLALCNRARLNFQAYPLRDMKWGPEKAVV